MASESRTTPERWRNRAAWVALVLGCIALLTANVALFLRAFVFDQDTFAAAVAPDEPDEQVIDGVADTLSERIVDSTAVQQRIDDLNPTDIPLLGQAVSNGAEGAIEVVVRQVLNSGAFRAVWRDAVEKAHTAFVDMVEDDSREPVVLNLTSVVSQVDQRLGSFGIDLFDDSTIQEIGDVVAVRRSQIAEARQWLELLRRGSMALAIAAVILLAAAVGVASDRRRMVVRLGLGMAVTMVVTWIAMRVAQRLVVDEVEVTARRNAVDSLWGRVFEALWRQSVAIFVVGLVLAAGAWLAGPSDRAAGLRRRVGGLRRSRSQPRPTITPVG